MIRTCPVCAADLGPSEDTRGCLTCRGVRTKSIATRAVALLERIDQPLPYWDIQRLIEANGGGAIREGSLKVQLATDKRTCWAGPGNYGLFRHGLLPGVRDLGSTASAYLLAADTTMSISELAFVLKSAGYRFREASLRSALLRGFGRPEGVSLWSGSRSDLRQQREAARVMGLRRGELFEEIMTRTAQQVAHGARELERRRS